ncbi:MAG: MATE family efflux transporter [Granulosicoccus sp.]
MVAQLLQMSNGLVDSIVAGQLGAQELAAGGIGASLWFAASLLCIGLMAGLSPTLSALIGQRRTQEIGRVFRQGIWLAIFTGAIALTVLLTLRLMLHHFPFSGELSALMAEYMLGAAFSLPFVAAFMAARNLCEAVGATRVVLLVTAVGLCINCVASAGLGLGLFGLPQLGLFGIGLATSLVNVCMAVSLFLVLTRSTFTRFCLFTSFERPQWAQLKSLLVLSIPIFLGMLFESGLFVATSLQMGMIGVIESGAHQIAISASGFCFMLPLGMSFALTARIARAGAQGKVATIYLRVISGALLIVLIAGTTALALALFRYQIAQVYTNDAEVIHLAVRLMLLGSVFQLSDSAQIVLIGILRGLHDTRIPMLINAFSYWVIAFGLGILSAHWLGWGAYGLWVGLIIGLSIAALLLGWRLRWMLSSGSWYSKTDIAS